MALQDLSALCIPLGLSITGGQICLTIPGQAAGSPTEKFCVTMPSLNFADFDLAKQMIAQLNAALFPYMPYLDAAATLIELFQCVVGIVKLIPTSVGDFATLPQKLADSATCLDVIRQKINAMLRALPPYSFLKIVYDASAVILAGIGGLRNEFETLLTTQLQVLQRAIRGARFGAKAQLLLALDCASGDINLQMQSLANQAEPLGQFLTLIAFLAQVGGAAAGGGSMSMSGILGSLGQASAPFADLSAFEAFIHTSLAPFDALLDVIRSFREGVATALSATQPPQI